MSDFAALLNALAIMVLLITAYSIGAVRRGREAGQAMSPRYDCGDTYCRDKTTPAGCKGHRLTRDIALAADVLAWADGWDSAAASDQAEDYYRTAAEALLHIQTQAGAA